MALAALAAAVLWLGCSRTPPSPPAEHTYTVRGRIAGLPSASAPGSSLQIQHEAIPEFVNSKGVKSGMASMTMPFPVAKGLEVSGLAVGDLVEFVWEMRWTPPAFSRVVQIKKLPAGTELDFGLR